MVLPWDDFEVWKKMKPTMPWGQLPCLTWNGERLCQSMTICRFLAREMGIAGRNSLEMAQVDEIVDVIQDAIEANVCGVILILIFFINIFEIVQSLVCKEQTRGVGHTDWKNVPNCFGELLLKLI